MPTATWLNRSILATTLISAAFLVSACGGGSSLASTVVDSRTTSVSSDGIADATLNQKLNGSVSSSQVGLVAYATGIDPKRGQIVGVTGIRDGADVGAPVTRRTVDYNVSYDYAVARDVTRGSSLISGTRGDRPGVGQTTLTADFDRGRLTGGNSELDVDARINGQAVSGNATVNYSLRRTIFGAGGFLTGTVETDLEGRIGSTGVIATFEGTTEDEVIVGGLVGTPD